MNNKLYAAPLDERDRELVEEYYTAVRQRKMSVADVLANLIAKHQAQRTPERIAEHAKSRNYPGRKYRR